MQKTPKSPLAIQIEIISKYLGDVKKKDILDFSGRIFRSHLTKQPYMALYLAIKKQASVAKSKGMNLGEFANEIFCKAMMTGKQIGDKFAALIKQEPEFLLRFDPNSPQVANIHKSFEQQSEKKQAPHEQQSLEKPSLGNEIESFFETKFPLKQKSSPVVQKLTPVSSPLGSYDFMFDSPIIKPKSPEFAEKNPAFTYKIGGPRPVQKQGENSYISSSQSNSHNINGNNINGSNRVNPFKQAINDQMQKTEREKQQEKGKIYEKPKSILEQRIDSISQKKKNDLDRLLNTIDDPLSSARPVTMSPSKPTFPSSTTNQVKTYSGFSAPQFQPKQTQVFPPPTKPKEPSSRYIDSNYLPNVSNKRQCLCLTLCENIVLSEDSFYCQHCENIYHTRCMRKQTDSRNCVICHLRMMIPNRLVTQEIFVGKLEKSKKKHEISFEVSEQMYHFIKSKKDFSHKLQLRCFRLKPQTQNQNLFPDSCIISINGKQLKQLKPLHKQSSLKYRRDEPLPILKHFSPGQNKIVVTEFHNANGIDRIEPEDHLIGLYLVEDEVLNSTVQRIIKNDVTSLRESKQLLNKAFNMSDKGNKSSEQMSEEEAITCEVIKIPLTCALTTEKLNYPARGAFCKHFQCFDLKNYIMMTSSSSNPRWVCPICKASCYDFRIDCILTEILNQYTGCDNVDVLVLYKDGMYEVIDKDEDSIDTKGKKLKNSEPKDIADLKIIDKFKRDREKQAEKQYLEQQQEQQKKKKKVVQLPPEDQIVCLLSDDD